VTITVLTPSYPESGRTDQKIFVDGIKKNKSHSEYPASYDVVHTIAREVGRNELETVYKILKEQEQNSKDWVLFFEAPLDQHTKIRADKMHLESDILRYVIQLDFDGTYAGANSLPLQERVERAIRLMPSLEDVGMVAHLSNKAGFIDEYPNHLALRLYIELDEATVNPRLRSIFQPYGLGSEVGIDHKLFSQRRKHLIQRPQAYGTKLPKEFPERCLKIPGGKLSLKKMVRSEHYLAAAAHVEDEDKVLTTLPSNHSVPSNKELAALDAFANSDGFDKTPRHYAHFKMLSQAIWKNQNEAVILDIICGNPKILGSKTRESLEQEIQNCHAKNKKYFDTDISLKEFDYRICRNHKDLQDADLDELFEQVSHAITKDTPLGIVLRSPHGSGKTMAVLPMLYELLSKKIVNRKVSLAYVTGLRSITTGTTRKLQGTIKDIVCYLDDKHEIRQEVIEEAHSIAIGLKSLGRLNKSYDLVFVDESEDAGMWAATFDNTFHNDLVMLMAKSKVFVVADADASSLTYSLAERAQEWGHQKLAFVDNKGSWIQGTTATLLEKQHQAYDKIIDLVRDDKKVFAHVDFAKDTLLATTNALNAELGETKVVSFCAKNGCSLKLSDNYKIYGMSGLHKLSEDPEETIDYLFSKGFQAIMVSPCIQKGWRYNSTVNNFDATVGVYIYDFITAPTIVQRTQRCVGVTNHYVFIQRVTNWVDAEKYEKILEEELSNSIYGGLDAIRSNPLRHNKEISNQATIINSRHKANIKLHFYYLWAWFGGKISHLEAKNDSEYKEIKRLIASSKKQLRLEEAREYRNCPDMLKGLIDRFELFSEKQKLRIRNIELEDIVDLLKRLERYEQREIDCQKVLRTLFATEETARDWDMYGAAYLDTERWKEEEITRRSLLNNDGGGHAKIWQLLHLINTEIWNKDNKDLRNIIARDKQNPIAIQTDFIGSTQFAKAFRNYREFYLGKLPSLKKYKDPLTFYKQLIQLVFQCKVKHPKADKVSEYTNALIRYYMDIGEIKKTKETKKGTNGAIASKKVRNKIMRGIKLHPTEEDFLNNSGKIMVIYLPDILPKKYYEMYLLLQIRYQMESTKDYKREMAFEAI
jgi:hypothetical protein